MRSVAKLAAVAVLSALAVSARASVDYVSLRSFKVLVPAYSKTSGGKHPALTRDARTLAYQGSGSSSVMIQRFSPNGDKDGEAWALEGVTAPGDGSWEPFDIMKENLYDWSPDGTKLAICGNAGRLYLAENFDFQAHKATVRALTEPDTTSPVLHCKWSPNGKMIAVCRKAGKGLGVYSLESGKETAIDADCWGATWNQPWSPDSKYLAYSRPKGGVISSGEDPDSEIVTAAVDTGEKRSVMKVEKSQPNVSWSPKGDRLAFDRSVSCTLTFPEDVRSPAGILAKKGQQRSTVIAYWSVGLDGKDAKPLCAGPRDESADPAVIRAYKKDMRSIFWRQFGAKLTPQQSNEFLSGKMSERDIYKIAVESAAQAVGGEFCDYVKQHPEALLDCDALGSAPPSHYELEKILKSIPEVKKDLFGQALSELLLRPMLSSFWIRPTDNDGVWSPDGRKFAFVRTIGYMTDQELIVADVADGDVRILCRSAGIQSAAWTADSRFIVCEADSFARDGMEADGERSQTASYPEIWLLELW